MVFVYYALFLVCKYSIVLLMFRIKLIFPTCLVYVLSFKARTLRAIVLPKHAFDMQDNSNLDSGCSEDFDIINDELCLLFDVNKNHILHKSLVGSGWEKFDTLTLCQNVL